MTYKVPGYAEVSHFHAPYKDSLEPGVMASSYVTSSAEVEPVSHLRSSRRRYDEISHFRAPYKDSMMGFGASPGSSSSMSASSSYTSPSSVSVTTGRVSVPKAKAPVGISAQPLTPPKTDLPKQPLSESAAEKEGFYLGSELLTYEANLVEYGADPRLWSLQTPRSFDAMFKTKMALVLTKNSKWRDQVRTSLIGLLRNYEPKSVRRVLVYAQKEISKQAIPPVIPGVVSTSLMTPLMSIAVEDAMNEDYLTSLALIEKNLFQDIARYNAATGSKLAASSPRRVSSRDVDDAAKAAEDSLKKAKEEIAELKKSIEDLKKQGGTVEEPASATASMASFFKNLTPVQYVVGATLIGALVYFAVNKEG